VHPQTWRLQGHDTFAREDYPLEGDFACEADAMAGARARLAALELEQPSASSGGQAMDGIQDRVFVIRPDGSTFRVVE